MHSTYALREAAMKKYHRNVFTAGGENFWKHCTRSFILNPLIPRSAPRILGLKISELILLTAKRYQKMHFACGMKGGVEEQQFCGL